MEELLWTDSEGESCGVSLHNRWASGNLSCDVVSEVSDRKLVIRKDRRDFSNYL